MRKFRFILIAVAVALMVISIAGCGSYKPGAKADVSGKMSDKGTVSLIQTATLKVKNTGTAEISQLSLIVDRSSDKLRVLSVEPKPAKQFDSFGNSVVFKWDQLKIGVGKEQVFCVQLLPTAAGEVEIGFSFTSNDVDIDTKLSTRVEYTRR